MWTGDEFFCTWDMNDYDDMYDCCDCCTGCDWCALPGPEDDLVLDDGKSRGQRRWIAHHARAGRVHVGRTLQRLVGRINTLPAELVTAPLHQQLCTVAGAWRAHFEAASSTRHSKMPRMLPSASAVDDDVDDDLLLLPHEILPEVLEAQFVPPIQKLCCAIGMTVNAYALLRRPSVAHLVLPDCATVKPGRRHRVRRARSAPRAQRKRQARADVRAALDDYYCTDRDHYSSWDLLDDDADADQDNGGWCGPSVVVTSDDGQSVVVCS